MGSIYSGCRPRLLYHPEVRNRTCRSPCERLLRGAAREQSQSIQSVRLRGRGSASIEPTCCCLPPGTRLPACTSPAGWPRSAAPPPAPESVARTEAPAARRTPEAITSHALSERSERRFSVDGLILTNSARSMFLEQELFISGEFKFLL